MRPCSLALCFSAIAIAHPGFLATAVGVAAAAAPVARVMRALVRALSLRNADPTTPPVVDDLIAAFEAHLASREVEQRLRQELAAAAAALPRRC